MKSGINTGKTTAPRKICFIILFLSISFCENNDPAKLAPAGPGVDLCTNVLPLDSFEADDTSSAAVILPADGTVQSHNFHSCQDVDFFKITISVAGYYTTKMFNLDTNLRAALILCSSVSSCSVFESANTAAGSIIYLTRYYAPGTFYLRNKTYDFTTGNYQINMPSAYSVISSVITDNEPANDTLSATNVPLSSANIYTAGSLNNPDANDYYRLTGLAAGTLYVISLHSTDLTTIYEASIYDTDANMNNLLRKEASSLGNITIYFTPAMAGDVYLNISLPVAATSLPDYEILLTTP